MPPSRRAIPVPSADAPPERLHARIQAHVKQTRTETTRTRTRIIAALAAVLTLTAAIVLIASEIVYRQPAAGIEVAIDSAPRMVFVLSVLVGLTAVSTVIALWRGQGFGVRAALLATVAGLVAPIYAVATIARPIHTGLADAAISPWGLRCIVIASMVGLIALASFAGALRRSAPVSSGLRGASVGAAAGAWAGLAVFMFCPSGDAQHVLVGHVLPIIAFTLAGGLSLARVLRP